MRGVAGVTGRVKSTLVPVDFGDGLLRRFVPILDYVGMVFAHFKGECRVFLTLIFGVSEEGGFAAGRLRGAKPWFTRTKQGPPQRTAGSPYFQARLFLRNVVEYGCGRVPNWLV